MIRSLLIRIPAGIEKPTAGAVWIGHRQVISIAARRFLAPRGRDVAIVFQRYALYAHMRAREKQRAGIDFDLANRYVFGKDDGRRLR